MAGSQAGGGDSAMRDPKQASLCGIGWSSLGPTRKESVCKGPSVLHQGLGFCCLTLEPTDDLEAGSDTEFVSLEARMALET